MNPKKNPARWLLVRVLLLSKRKELLRNKFVLYTCSLRSSLGCCSDNGNCGSHFIRTRVRLGELQRQGSNVLTFSNY